MRIPHFEYDTIEAMKSLISDRLTLKKQSFQKNHFKTSLLLKFFKDKEKSLLGLLKRTSREMSTLTRSFMWERMKLAGLSQQRATDTIMKPPLSMGKKFQKTSRLRFQSTNSRAD